MSGALSWMSRLRRLLRLMTRRYRSFRSDVANRPPSSWTMGRSSGGITGSTSMTIHSGLLPDRRKASTTSRRLTMRAFFWPEASLSSAWSWADRASRSTSCRSFFTASAPMPAWKSFSYFSR